MNASAHSSFFVALRPAAHRPRRAFALIVTLLILSLLVIVAVSYLSSMVSERQTSDAYTSKTRAEQVAQAGVDSAMAILTESFRDFPDSATVWDTQQSKNANAADFNEGTSLYLRAMPMVATLAGASVTVANPQPNGTAAAANDVAGNNPNNPACKTFVLPLISGVPDGRARLVADSKSAVELPVMSPVQSNATTANFTDLNVRRSNGDTQGAIGSPPNWPTANGPKPARALWVNLKDNDGRVTGRYAFWIEDESFRVNVNASNKATNFSAGTSRIDNSADAATQKYPIDPTTKQPYIASPIDADLGGALAAFSSTSTSDAQKALSARSFYPGKFFPEPMSFSHAYNDDPQPLSAATTKIIDGLRYLTTTQSGTVNVTRHGTERLNLNTAITTVAPTDTATIQKQIDQIVQTLQFHLPNFGQRFYRNSVATDAATLNNTTTVSQTASMKTRGVGDPALIYLYKVAANIRDYVDTDSQPTMVLAGGNVAPATMISPVHPIGEDSQPNPYWAIGKEAAPFLQETAIRFRPVAPQSAATGGKGNFTLAIDYYLEFWNLTDHDIYAAPQTDPAKASMNGARIAITYQQSWNGYPSGAPLQCTVQPNPKAPGNDFVIDLSKGADAKGNAVVFRAGAATVITTDPDYQTYHFATPIHSSTKYTSLTDVPNPQTTFLCPIIAPGTRTYAGKLPGTDYGLQPEFRDGTQDYQTEVTLFNQYGYFDSASFGIAEGGSPVSTYTDKNTGDGDYNNYSYGGSLYGNTIASETGDPRTNNEQMYFSRVTGSAGDLSRYYNGNHTLGYPNANYVQPVGGTFKPPGGSNSNFITWPDYYSWANTTGYTNPTPATAPAVIADKSLASIGQLGDVYDPARINGSVIEMSRGGGRTFKIGQRDDRITYDPTGNAAPNNTLDFVPTSQGWAAWRLTDIFSAGPVDLANPTGPVQDPIELPARFNINGVARDNGAALRALLTGFNFQPATADPVSSTSEPLFHTPTTLAGMALSLQSTDTVGLAKLVTQITTRLQTSPSAANVPWGPFFERGELGELEVGGTAIFGKNVPSTSTATSNDLAGSSVDLNRTFDRGREELARRLSEMICTRGDTFTVYAVGQSIQQRDTASPPLVAGTHRMRVTFRLVPKIKDAATGSYRPFHPAYSTVSDSDPTITGAVDYNPGTANATNNRFVKPDRYDAQILEVNVF